MRALVFTIVFVSSMAAPIQAQIPAATVSAVGNAVREVSLDQAGVTFELATERDSFAAAVAAAEATVARLRKLPAPAEGASVTFEYDLTQLRQTKWSRGKKLEQQFQAVVRQVPDGAVQQVLVRLIDAVIEAEPGMTVARYDTFLSDAKRSAVEREMLGEAVLDARTTAAVMAEAAGLRLDSTRIVVPGSRIGRAEVDGLMLQESMSVVPARRSFTAQGDATGTIRLPVAVTVTFNAAPK